MTIATTTEGKTFDRAVDAVVPARAPRDSVRA